MEREFSGRRDQRILGLDFNYHNTGSASVLRKAVRAGCLSIVMRMISRGKNPDLPDNRGWTALHEASLDENNGAVLSYLLEQGAYIEHKTVEGESALFLAASKGNFPGVVALLRHGADLHSRTSEGLTPLHASCMSTSNIEVLRYLLGAGASPEAENSEGCCALYTAIEENTVEAVRILLKVTPLRLERRDEYNILLYSISRGSPRIFQTMVNSSPEVAEAAIAFSTLEGWTLLMEAAQGRDPDTVEWLLELGADPSKVDHRGVTALHVAAHSSDPRSFPLLLKAIPLPAVVKYCVFNRQLTSPVSLPCLLMDGDSLDNFRLLNETNFPTEVLTCHVQLQARTLSPAGFLFYRCSRLEQKRKIEFLTIMMKKELPLDVYKEDGYLPVLEAILDGHKSHHLVYAECNCVEAIEMCIRYKCYFNGSEKPVNTLFSVSADTVLPIIVNTLFAKFAVVLFKNPHLSLIQPDLVAELFVKHVIEPKYRFTPEGEEELFLKTLLPYVASFEHLKMLNNTEECEPANRTKLVGLYQIAMEQQRKLLSLKKLSRGMFLYNWVQSNSDKNVMDIELPRTIKDFLLYNDE